MKAEPLGTAYWNSRKVWLDRLTQGHNGMELLDCNAGMYLPKIISMRGVLKIYYVQIIILSTQPLTFFWDDENQKERVYTKSINYFIKPTQMGADKSVSTARPRDARILVPEINPAAQNRASWGLYLCTKWDFFQKTVYLQGFCSKSVFCEVTPMY